MRYDFLLFLLAFRTTHSLVLRVNTTARKNERVPPKINAPPQIPSEKPLIYPMSYKENYNKNNETNSNVRNLITPPSRPPVASMVEVIP